MAPDKSVLQAGAGMEPASTEARIGAGMEGREGEGREGPEGDRPHSKCGK